MIIAFEGIHGCGKTTQMKKLNNWIKENTNTIVKTTKWNSYPVLDDFCNHMKLNSLFSPLTFSLASALDFNLRYEQLIIPNDTSEIILADRYIYTAYVRDTLRGIPNNLLDLIYGNTKKPDIVFYFDISPEISIARIGHKLYSRSSYILGQDLNLSDDIVKNFKLYLSLQIDKYNEIINSNSSIFFKVNSLDNEDTQFKYILHIFKAKLNQIKNCNL